MSSQSAFNGSAEPPLILLVLQADKYDWPSIIHQALLTCHKRPTRPLRVIQSSWDSLDVGPCSNDPVTSHGRVLRYGTAQVRLSALWRDGERTPLHPRLLLSPDFLLVRNECVTPHASHRAALLGLLYAGIPAVNPLRSILLHCDRPVMHAALHRLRAQRFRGRPDAFPLIAQDFYPSVQGWFYGGRFPAVVKVGSAHAGEGKVRVRDHHDMRDVQGLVGLTREGYATAEAFVEAETDVRVQWVGGRVRAYERRGLGGGWKSNVGGAEVVEVDVRPEWREWAEAAAVMFGEGEEDRMDVCTVDALVSRPHAVTAEVKTVILEVNGTSSGLMPEREDEDNLDIAAIVLRRMADIYDV